MKQLFPAQVPEHTPLVPRMSLAPPWCVFNTNCHNCLSFLYGGMWCPLLEETSLGNKPTPAPASKQYLTPSTSLGGASLSTYCCRVLA